MANIANWLGQSQYSNWNRTLGLRQSPYLARTDTRLSRTATQMAQQQQQQQDAVVINMGELTLTPTHSSMKKQDTLFGPNIGIVARGPAWTENKDKAVDELTPEIVRGWIAKSKEAKHSTTTLQALVNLKRPSLRLTPLEVDSSDDPNHIDSQHHHGLEFEYDCDAPKCGITVHVVLSPTHHLVPKNSDIHEKVLVFEAITDGGFGKTLKLEEGATLELGRYDHSAHPTAPEEKKNEAGPSVSAPDSQDATATDNAASRKSKRFTSFHFRKRTTQQRSVAGPALAVVDAESHAHGEDSTTPEANKDDSEEGVKAIIRLTALDEKAKPLNCPNEQTTYLHIVRFGAAPAAGEHDKRPWVVKVVKREATIGSHTFQLHEIYGLSSASNSTSNPTSHPTQPLPTSYPPTAAPGAPMADDEPSSECLLCLSAPREVVLLPCRHLVACRDCAVNMIEFGAGGQIVQPAEGSGSGAAGEGEGGENGEGAADVTDTQQALATVVPATTTRRKRKAKGWFCPVCRQPYTSCLRITTTPPSKDVHSEDEHEHPEGQDITDHPLANASPQLPPAAAPSRSGGGFTSIMRPGFFRQSSRPQPPDLERGQQVPTAAA